jgi:hypothetical protein
VALRRVSKKKDIYKNNREQTAPQELNHSNSFLEYQNCLLSQSEHKEAAENEATF